MYEHSVNNPECLLKVSPSYKRHEMYIVRITHKHGVVTVGGCVYIAYC